MEASNMRKIALLLAVVAVPSAASAADGFTVPAIISTAQAQPAPQAATPPPGIVNPPPPPAASSRSDAAATLTVTSGGGALNAPPPPLPLLSPNTSLTPRQTQAATIAHRWRARTASPGEGPNGSVRFAFGASIPSVVCSPLYVCSVTLQPGEVVNDIKAGDSVRWLITPAVMGTGASATTIVSVKPTDAGLRTNLIIATTRRLYEIQLVSHTSAYTGSVSFTYPEDPQVAWQQYQADAQRRFTDTTLATVQSLASLDFNYSLSGDRPAWRPLRVYSDGIKTYIQFPRSMLSGDAPSLVSLANDGGWFSSPTKQIVNYRVQGDTYVVDRVLSRAALLLGVGGSQNEVQITHTGGKG